MNKSHLPFATALNDINSHGHVNKSHPRFITTLKNQIVMLTLKSCKQIPPPHTLHSALFSMHFRHGFLDAFWHAFISILDQFLSPKGSPSGCHHEGRAPAQDTEHRIQDTRYKIQDTRYRTRYRIQNTRYKIQDIR